MNKEYIKKKTEYKLKKKSKYIITNTPISKDINKIMDHIDIQLKYLLMDNTIQ